MRLKGIYLGGQRMVKLAFKRGTVSLSEYPRVSLVYIIVNSLNIMLITPRMI